MVRLFLQGQRVEGTKQMKFNRRMMMMMMMMMKRRNLQLSRLLLPQEL
jgi:hypothetical protein